MEEGKIKNTQMLLRLAAWRVDARSLNLLILVNVPERRSQPGVIRGQRGQGEECDPGTSMSDTYIKLKKPRHRSGALLEDQDQ